MEVTKKTYQLPALRFGYKDLEPFMSEEQLTLHHTKHHAAYATGANAALDKLEKARKEGTDADQKAIMKELSFNVGGFILHNRFWENLAPVGKGGDSPGGKLGDAIAHEFGSFERFKKEFTQVASSAEGSGWAVLTYLSHHRKTHDNAGGEAQCQCHAWLQATFGPGCMGARLLCRLP